MTSVRRPHRRAFLAHSAAITATAALAAELRADEPTSPIIDTHQHLWDLGKFRLPWLAGAAKLDRNFLPDDYKAATEGLNVVKAIYMEVDVDPAQQIDEVKAVVALCRRADTPTVAAVVSGRPASPTFREYVKQIRAFPEVKGIRQVLHAGNTPAGYGLDPKFLDGLRVLGENGLSFDLCVRTPELADAAKIVDACPGTKFILDHCGNAGVRDDRKAHEAWKADLASLARRERVVCKVSGIVASTQGQPWKPEDLAPIVNHVLDTFGPDRVMFGGDWPVCTLGATFRQWVEALRVIVRDRPAAERRKLFHDNAVRIYRLNA